MVFLMGHLVVLLAVLAVTVSSFKSTFSALKSRNHGITSDRDALQMGSHGIYDIKSDNGVHSISFEVAGKSMSFETGKMGRQAGGSVVSRTQDTMVYTTVCNERDANPVDFTPLRVDWFARYSSVGQTVGAFHRRDCRGDDAEILVARLIDRPIRPMIADGWQHETQILTWVLSYDKIHSPEALSICSASAAMCISEVPFSKPVAGVEIGLVDGVLTVNPTKAEMAKSTLQLTVAGTKDGILMIEGAADFLPEATMVDALRLGHAAIGVICDGLSAFQTVAGKPKKIDTLRKIPVDLVDSMEKLFGAKLDVALSIAHKQTRGAAVAKVEVRVLLIIVRVRGGVRLNYPIASTVVLHDFFLYLTLTLTQAELVKRFCTELPPTAPKQVLSTHLFYLFLLLLHIF
jgi:ribonuclease PH